MDERQFFDKLAPSWDDNEVLSTPDKINNVLDYIDIRNGMSVLDLGTGTGVLLPYIAERVGPTGRITAIDYSKGMLGRAKAKYSGLIPRPKFVNLDFEKENIFEKYDRIILYCVYPHLHTPFETLEWMKTVNLTQNGIITVAFPTGPDFINNVHREKHSESDILPPASVLAAEMRLYRLDARVAREDENAYIINIYKD